MAIDVAMAKDAAERKDASMAKWIRLAGKPNREFLAKPRAAKPTISNMTMDNTVRN